MFKIYSKLWRNDDITVCGCERLKIEVVTATLKEPNAVKASHVLIKTFQIQ